MTQNLLEKRRGLSAKTIFLTIIILQLIYLSPCQGYGEQEEEFDVSERQTADEARDAWDDQDAKQKEKDDELAAQKQEIKELQEEEEKAKHTKIKYNNNGDDQEKEEEVNNDDAANDGTSNSANEEDDEMESKLKKNKKKLVGTGKLQRGKVYVPKFHNDVLNEETGKMESAFKAFVRKQGDDRNINSKWLGFNIYDDKKGFLVMTKENDHVFAYLCILALIGGILGAFISRYLLKRFFPNWDSGVSQSSIPRNQYEVERKAIQKHTVAQNQMTNKHEVKQRDSKLNESRRLASENAQQTKPQLQYNY